MPVIAINYGKAPQHPYPYALEEVYDAYRTLTESNGSCIGIKCQKLKVIIGGDSAGANLATGVILRTLEPTSVLPPVQTPSGCLLIYPCLSLDMACWMQQRHMSLIRNESRVSITSLQLLQAGESPLGILN